jgi:hypothetical protein
MQELNLENPIFVIYLDANGYTPQKTQEAIEKLNSNFSFKNSTTWIIPTKNSTKIELIWQGSNYSNNPGFEKI